MTLKWNFQGGGGIQFKKPSMGMDIFWSNTINKNKIWPQSKSISSLSINCGQFIWDLKKTIKNNKLSEQTLSSDSKWESNRGGVTYCTDAMDKTDLQEKDTLVTNKQRGFGFNPCPCPIALEIPVFTHVLSLKILGFEIPLPLGIGEGMDIF